MALLGVLGIGASLLSTHGWLKTSYVVAAMLVAMLALQVHVQARPSSSRCSLLCVTATDRGAVRRQRRAWSTTASGRSWA